MKLKLSELRALIKEEMENVVNEAWFSDPPATPSPGPWKKGAGERRADTLRLIKDLDARGTAATAFPIHTPGRSPFSVAFELASMPEDPDDPNSKSMLSKFPWTDKKGEPYQVAVKKALPAEDIDWKYIDDIFPNQAPMPRSPQVATPLPQDKLSDLNKGIQQAKAKARNVEIPSGLNIEDIDRALKSVLPKLHKAGLDAAVLAQMDQGALELLVQIAEREAGETGGDQLVQLWDRLDDLRRANESEDLGEEMNPELLDAFRDKIAKATPEEIAIMTSQAE